MKSEHQLQGNTPVGLLVRITSHVCHELQRLSNVELASGCGLQRMQGRVHVPDVIHDGVWRIEATDVEAMVMAKSGHHAFRP